MFIEHTGEFAHGHAVTRSDWKLPDKRGEGGIKHSSCDLASANGIRSITRDYFLPKLLCRAHAISQRVDERVNATAHALQITDDDIDVLEHLFRRLTRFTIQRKDWQTGLPVCSVSGLNHVVLRVTPNSVLRPEERSQVDIRM